MKNILFLTILIYNCQSQGKVDPPNYDFSLETLKVFSPNATFPIQGNKEKISEAKLIEKNAQYSIYRYYVEHIRYRFPVFVQVNNSDNKILDFFARIPQYFLSGIFHQSLINRLGNQDQFIKVEENGIYVWKNKNSVNHIYSSTCTITCFPIFYTQFIDPKSKQLSDYNPLFYKMNQEKIN